MLSPFSCKTTILRGFFSSKKWGTSTQQLFQTTILTLVLFLFQGIEVESGPEPTIKNLPLNLDFETDVAPPGKTFGSINKKPDPKYRQVMFVCWLIDARIFGIICFCYFQKVHDFGTVSQMVTHLYYDPPMFGYPYVTTRLVYSPIPNPNPNTSI